MKYFVLICLTIFSFSSIGIAQKNKEDDLYELFERYKKERPNQQDSLINFIEQKIEEIEQFDINSVEEEQTKNKYKGHLFLKLGNSFRYTNEINSALESFTNAIKFYQSCGSCQLNLGGSYSNAASIYRLKKDFNKANEYYDEAARIYIENDKIDRAFNVYFELINSYNIEGFSPYNSQVVYLYQKAKRIEGIEDWKKISLELIVTCEQFIEQEKYEEAISIMDEAIKVYEETESKYKATKHPLASYMLTLKIHVLIDKAELQIKKLKQYDKAKKNLDLVDKIIETKSIDLKLYNKKAHLLLTKANYYTAQQQYDTAQNYHQQILQFINPLFTYETIHQNPSPNQISGNPYLLTTLADKAEVYKKMYTQTNNKTNLTYALDCYELSYTAADQMRKEYSFEDANTYLSGYTYSYYEKAIELCHQLAKAYPNQTQKYQNKAFEITQRSNMKTLFWTINSKVATKFLSKEDSTELAHLREQLVKAKESITEKNNSKKQEKDLFEARQNYNQLEKRMEAKYPEYAKLKFENQLVPVDTLQENRINDNEALLSYFVGDSIITCFVVTQTSFHIVEINEVDAVLENNRSWRESIQKKETSNELAAELYQQLLSEVLSYLPENIHTLIINPDAALASLPFEALKEQANKQDYLLHKYIISYTLHPYFIKKRQGKSLKDKLSGFLSYFQEKKKFKGFTANYSNHPDELSPLPFANEEIEKIQQIIGGSVYHLATKKIVIEQLKDSKEEIIHFATHAVGDSLETTNSKIFLTPYADVDVSSQDDLYLDDILNLNCTADLVVLSACQTGLGVYNQGEGISSLARAFRTIGSKSVLMSLWKANDLSTARIMENFYQLLENGELKNEALRQAKIDFLNSNIDSHQKHPFYWAAFLLQGEPHALY